MIKRAMLLHLPPKAVQRIIEGKQRFLFKRLIPRQPFSRVEVFCDWGSPLLVMEILPGELLSGTRPEIQDLCFRFSGMQWAEWNALFFGANMAAAVEISAVQPVKPALQFDVVKHWRLNQAPQNLCYVPCPSWPLGVPSRPAQQQPGELFPAL